MEGKKSIRLNVQPEPLDSKEAVLPSGFVAVLIHHLSKDVNEWTPSIQSIYYDFDFKLVRPRVSYSLEEEFHG